MSEPLSVVDSGLHHDDDTLGVRDFPGESQADLVRGLPRVERRDRMGVSEDKLSEKDPWLESGHIQIPFPEIWF